MDDMFLDAKLFKQQLCGDAWLHSKATKKLKGAFSKIYAVYAGTFWQSMLVPRFFTKLCLHDMSTKFTVGFSNGPGPVKSYWYQNEKGQKSYGRWCHSYVVVSGRVGLVVSCVSYIDTFKICATADEALCKDTRFLVDSIYKNIEDEMQRMKDVPVPKRTLKGNT